VNNFLWKIYLYRFFEAFKLIGVIFTLFFQHNGLTTFEISILIAMWSVTQLILEVPLGVFADKYSRRNLLVIALGFLIIGFLFWLKGGFLFYAIGFVFWGVKNALTSGTLEAFVYDELKTFGKEDQYEKVNGRLEALFWSGVTVSALLGGLVASISFNLVLALTIVSTLFAAVSLLLIKPVQSVRSTGESKYLLVLKEALNEVKTNKGLLKIMVFFCLVFATYGAADEYWALVYGKLGIPIALIGFLVAAGYGLFALAGSTLKLFKFKNSAWWLIVISGIIFILSGLVNSVVSIPLLLLGLYLFKVAHIKYDVQFQQSITGGERATVSSLKSLVFEVVYMGFVLFFGFISTKVGIISVVYLLGIMLLFWLVISKLFLREKQF